MTAYAGSRRIEAFFAAHPDLTDRDRALMVTASPEDVIPWERIIVPHEVDGTLACIARLARRAPCGGKTATKR